MQQPRQAAALMDSFRQFTLPYTAETVVETLREHAKDEALDFHHVMADLIESQADQIKALQVRLAAEKIKSARLTGKLRKARR